MNQRRTCVPRVPPLLRVCRVINNLNVGGAELMLHKLLSQVDRSQFDNRVITLMGRGPVAEPIERLGVPIEICRMQPGLPTPASFWRLCRHLASIVESLFHSDFVRARRWLRPRRMSSF